MKSLLRSPFVVSLKYPVRCITRKVIIRHHEHESDDTIGYNFGEIVESNNTSERVKWSQVLGKRIEYGISSFGDHWVPKDYTSRQLIIQIDDANFSILPYDSSDNISQLRILSTKQYENIDWLTEAFVRFDSVTNQSFRNIPDAYHLLVPNLGQSIYINEHTKISEIENALIKVWPSKFQPQSIGMFIRDANGIRKCSHLQLKHILGQSVGIIIDDKYEIIINNGNVIEKMPINSLRSFIDYSIGFACLGLFSFATYQNFKPPPSVGIQ